MKKRNLSKSNSPSSVNHGNSFIGKELILDGHDRTDLSFKVSLNTIPSISLQTYEPDIHLRH
jgi:hypothetical protein